MIANCHRVLEINQLYKLILPARTHQAENKGSFYQLAEYMPPWKPPSVLKH